MSIWTLIIVLAAAYLILRVVARPQPYSGRSFRERRRDASQANDLLTQAESKYLMREDGAAEALFQRAYSLADGADALLCSEALYGLARVAMRRRDYQSAVSLIERAIALKDQWPVEKPNFVLLLERERERASSASGS